MRQYDGGEKKGSDLAKEGFLAIGDAQVDMAVFTKDTDHVDSHTSP